MTNGKSFRLAVAILAALLAVVFTLPAAYAEGEGSVSGKVQNKTQGGGSVAGLEVTLRTLAHQADGGAASSTTDAEGSFHFDKLITAPNYAYGLIVTYQGITYGSDMIVFASGETAKSVDLTVYETADSPDKISIERAHIVLGAPSEKQTLPVMEIVIVSNDGDRVYVPRPPAQGSVEITLPDGAQNLEREPELDASSIDTPGGFAYAEPLLPGSSQFLYSYELPYGGSRFDLSHVYNYPVQQMSVLLPDGGVKASSGQLSEQPARNIGGQSYLHLQGADIPAGKTVAVQLDGLPVPSIFSRLPDLSRWAIPGVIALAFVGVIAFVLFRRPSSSPESMADESVDERLEEDLDDDIDEDDAEYDPAEEPTRRR